MDWEAAQTQYLILTRIKWTFLDTPVRHAELRDSVWISRGFISGLFGTNSASIMTSFIRSKSCNIFAT